MKKLFLITFTLLISCFTWAQTTPAKPKPKPAAPKPAPPQPALKTLTDSASYAIGVSVASFYREQGVTKLNTSIISAAINDVLTGKKLKMDEFTCNTVMNKVMSKLQDDKIKPTIDSGNAFLARNKQRPEVKTTASGLQYEVIVEGKGVKPTAVDTFVAHYRGTLLNGTEFDASYPRGQPLQMGVSQVIKGWTEGLQLMGVGSKYKFYIPYDLAYGPYDNGAIPGGSLLVFEVELIDVKKTQ